MKLKEILTSLNKFNTSDFWDHEVIFIGMDKDNENPTYNLIGGIGCFKNIAEFPAITIISDEYCHKLIKDDKVEMKKDIPDELLGE